MIAAPVPDGGGKREQDVWFRFAQVDCDRAGPDGYGVGASCTAKTQTWETYWYTRNPGKADAFGPEVSASDSFYANLLAVHRYWTRRSPPRALAPAAGGRHQRHVAAAGDAARAVDDQPARHVASHPRRQPGLRLARQDSFQDVFTSTATMALSGARCRLPRA